MGRNADVPPWLQKAIDEARSEGRIVTETRVAASFYHDTKGIAVNVSAGLISKDTPEKEFQQWVLDRAKYWGWRTIHIYPLLTSDGYWKTPVAGDGKGFPDTLFLREIEFVAELKSGYNKTSPEQDEWLAAFRRVGRPTFVWYPEDAATIESVLELGAACSSLG